MREASKEMITLIHYCFLFLTGHGLIIKISARYCSEKLNVRYLDYDPFSVSGEHYNEVLDTSVEFL